MVCKTACVFWRGSESISGLFLFEILKERSVTDVSKIMKVKIDPDTGKIIRSAVKEEIPLSEKAVRYAQKQKEREENPEGKKASDNSYHTRSAFQDCIDSIENELIFFSTLTRFDNQDGKKLIQDAERFCKDQGSKYYVIILEVDHPEDVYERDENGYKTGKYILPFCNENFKGFHVHVLSDIQLNIEKWNKIYKSDIKNLYSNCIYSSVYCCEIYLEKYIYYTKRHIGNVHMYRCSTKKKKYEHEVYRINNDTKEILYSSLEKKERNLEILYRKQILRQRNTDKIHLNRYLRYYIKENHTFYNVLNKQNVLRFSSSIFDNFISSISINSDVFIKYNTFIENWYNSLFSYKKWFFFTDLPSIFNSKLRLVVPESKYYIKDSKIKAWKSDTGRCKLPILQEKSLKYIEFSFEKSNTEQCACSVPFSWENWLLKYIVFIKTIPKNG